MYKVKKMLQERIAFVTLDKQMYLPFMALHIKKNRMNDAIITEREKFTAATQLVFLYILYSEKTEFGTDELAKSLNVSSMTILRAMEELKHLNIIKQGIAGKTGRKKLYAPIEKKNYYRIGKEYLVNPVNQIVTKAQALAEGLPEIQIMQYDIGRLTKNQYVDPVSLLMSITRIDDRTEIAIDELMEGAEWYEE